MVEKSWKSRGGGGRGSVAVGVVVVAEPGTAADSAGPTESNSSRPELGLLGLFG